MRIGTAPDSWGVWFADDPRQTPWPRFLDEVAQAGYRHVELGPFGYLPTDPALLADELAARGLTLSGGTVFSDFHRGDRADTGLWEKVRAIAHLVRAVGGEHVVVIPALWRDDRTGRQSEPRTLTDDQWTTLAAGHDLIGQVLAQEYGLAQQVHSHADTHVATPTQVDRLLELTDPRYVNLCLDTGHYAYYGGDSVALLTRAPDRIGYLHLKQIDPTRARELLDGDVPFVDAACQVMVAPPAGLPDYGPVLAAAHAADPDMFAIVEQDMPGCDPAQPLPIAVATRAYIEERLPA
ncbi:MAG: sugar phosphate isomerase/epimerase [Gordonia sp. (in: high G+C Gram-positive bacteria)]|uniref:sugar phosphate isomerase/epimerase family protein n=1 Tax=Gordonia sp. (in: high G+C Gram-positive bacteria) TaxID=84139 RepID=UPI003BB64099